MCIIAVYPKGTKPDKKTLETMIRNNPDGVGVAYNTGREVVFKKGLESAEQVLNFYNQNKREIDFFVFHARIATSGGVSAEKCHPFPLTANLQLLNVTSGRTATPLCFHNGVFNIPVETGLNDTQTLIKNCLAPLYKLDKKGVKNGKYIPLIRQLTTGSRFVILTASGVQVFGSWEQDKGVYYSNTHYKPYTSYYTSNDWQKWATARDSKHGDGASKISSYVPTKYRLDDDYTDI